MSEIDIQHVAKLARLDLTQEELGVFKPQLPQILAFVEKLKEVNVESVEPTSHPLALQNVFRDDRVLPSLPIEEFLKRAPGTRGRFFEVPKVIEDRA